ncbi:hypothetical protein [Georgenia yuyongxinii]
MDGGTVHIPWLVAIETVSVPRSWVRRGELADERGAAALDDLTDLPAQRWPHEPLLGGV